MSKIFRLHTGAGQNIEHWQEITSHLSDNFINSIEDPSGSTAHTQITSIPSPFARMDLVRTAFKYVNSKRELEGNTIYHRMVSECLDIAEIFFNHEALQDKVEVLEWNSGVMLNGGELDIDPSSDLGALLASSNVKHQLLGETLKMFLFQDKNAFNFSRLKNIYLLNYKQGPELINIIGGTSPATLFFSSANDLSYVDISFGNDKVFDHGYCALIKRGRDFIKFLYSLQLSFDSFSETFPEINNYLDLTFQELNESLKNSIRGLDNTSYKSSYNLIPVLSEGNNAEILGFSLRAKNYGVASSSDDNDFAIDGSKLTTGLLPLVLPNEPFNEPLKYAGGLWQKNYHEKVLAFDERPLSERTLPNQSHIKYPYLTVSDLLEPYLMRLPYPTDNEKFFDGHYEVRQGEKDHGFALPIKKKFFEYFTIKDLQGSVADGKKRFELIQMPGGIKAVLRISIKNNRYVQLSRMYNVNQFQDRIQPANEKQNLGVIVDSQFTLALYPFLKLNTLTNPHYRILLVDRDVQPLNKQYNYNVNFYTEANPTQAILNFTKKVRSSKHQAQGVTTDYYVLESEFEFLEVSHNNATGILVPLFKVLSSPSKKFKFAIDFGTTNTHIEYKVGSDNSRPFDINDNDIQVATLHSAEGSTEHFFSVNATRLGIGVAALTSIIREEFLPFKINSSLQYKFPQRTVIYDNGMFNPDEASFALADFNIPFWYLKESYNVGVNNNSEVTANLKWADFNHNKKLERRTKGFLEQLMLMIRNKVLLNGGDLASTEIVWFYPSSMPLFRRRFLQDLWDTYYKRYFSNGTNLFRMSESLAPFHYFKEKGGVIALDKPVVSIDIGGGTTDVVVYTDNVPTILTSFKFASNALFGDGYGNTSSTNGFVYKYEKIIRDSLSNTSGSSLISVLDNIKSKNSKSLELIEFFFSLEENKLIKDKNISLSFSKLLAEDVELKIVFLLYYAAIIYHIARLMKAANLQPPRFITFSGNGSKIVSIASGSSDLDNLTSFTKIVFADVYDTAELSLLQLKLYPNPKEITSKGGLECTDYRKYNDIELKIKKVLVGTTENKIVPETSISYREINNDTLTTGVSTEVEHFVERFFKWNNKINYYNYFGINPGAFDKYRVYLKEDLKTFLLAGIEEKLKEVQDNLDVDIDETLFFYPLIGALNKLAYKIETNK